MIYLYAFLIGGLFCAIAQLLIDLTKVTPARIMVIFVVSGVVLSAFGIYQKIVDFAGAGATVPIIGFGHLLATSTKKFVEDYGILGAFIGGLTGAAGGITAAIFFGYLASVLYKSKTK